MCHYVSGTHFKKKNHKSKEKEQEQSFQFETVQTRSVLLITEITKMDADQKKVQISFHRKKFSVETCEYLCKKMDEENESDIIHINNIKGLTDGTITKLLVKDANELVKVLLKAIIINDDLEMKDEETGQSNDETDQEDSEHETETEDGLNTTIVNGSNKDPSQGTSKTFLDKIKVPPKTQIRKCPKARKQTRKTKKVT